MHILAASLIFLGIGIVVLASTLAYAMRRLVRVVREAEEINAEEKTVREYREDTLISEMKGLRDALNAIRASS